MHLIAPSLAERHTVIAPDLPVRRQPAAYRPWVDQLRDSLSVRPEALTEEVRADYRRCFDRPAVIAVLPEEQPTAVLAEVEPFLAN